MSMSDGVLREWRPSLGAWPEAGGVRFRVWAPDALRVELCLESDQTRRMERHRDGTWGLFAPDLGAGASYRYAVDGAGPFPDPCSRYQPQGVHGVSEVVDPTRYRWRNSPRPGGSLSDLVLYELHVGTFSPEGTFQAARARLPHLKELGITAIELMPLGDFPGERNWGYDGVALYAPARCHGTPDDLRALIDEAHGLGLQVHLDVVYNHLGPDGNYTGAYSDHYLSPGHHTPWGKGLNYDGPHSEQVRAFFIENALHWIHEYRVDGLRLDATHAIVDDRSRPFLCELADRVGRGPGGRPIWLIAEDHRNDAVLIRPPGQAGWGLDGVWADDFHHVVRATLAGDREGHYQDFEGNASELERVLNTGWLYCGEFSKNRQGPRGTQPTGLRLEQFVHCIQNHDQIGNRAFGDRLSATAQPAAYRAASALLLFSRAIPLLFMGQEWAASTPFLYFTDHKEPLGAQVSQGRRREFRQFRAFQDPASRDRIPDPQAAATFESSRLDWDEAQREPHASMLRLYQFLLRFRQTELKGATRQRAAAIAEQAVAVRRDRGKGQAALVCIANLKGRCRVNLTELPLLVGLDTERTQRLLYTEDSCWAPGPGEAATEGLLSHGRIELDGPAALIVRIWPGS